VRIAVTIAVGMIIILYFSSDYVLGIFTKDPEILALGKQILFVDIFLEIGRSINITMVRALQATGDIKMPVVVGIISMWSTAVGLAYFFGIVMGMGLVGIWIGMAADECVRAVIFVYRWHSGAWKNKKLMGTV